MDLLPAEPWLRPGGGTVEVVEARPWSGLPVVDRALRARLGHDVGWRLHLHARSTRARAVRVDEFAFDVERAGAFVSLGAGVGVENLRIGDGFASARRVAPRLQLLGRAAAARLFLRWSHDRVRASPIGAWTAALAVDVRDDLRVGVQRELDRHGTGAVWSRSVVLDALGPMALGLTWFADDTCVVVELRRARWRLRVVQVVDGPRDGGQALALGWGP